MQRRSPPAPPLPQLPQLPPQPLPLLLACSQGCRLSTSGSHMLGCRPGRPPPPSSTSVLACGYAATAALMVSARRGADASCHRLCGRRMLWQNAVPRRARQALHTHLADSRSSSDSRRGREACARAATRGIQASRSRADGAAAAEAVGVPGPTGRAPMLLVAAARPHRRPAASKMPPGVLRISLARQAVPRARTGCGWRLKCTLASPARRRCLPDAHVLCNEQQGVRIAARCRSRLLWRLLLACAGLHSHCGLLQRLLVLLLRMAVPLTAHGPALRLSRRRQTALLAALNISARTNTRHAADALWGDRAAAAGGRALSASQPGAWPTASAAESHRPPQAAGLLRRAPC